MAFDPLVGWDTGKVVHSGDESSNGSTTFSTKNAQDLEKLLQDIVDALDYIANN